MEFLVAFEVTVPDGTPESEVGEREHAEASAAAKLAHDGHLVRVWKSRSQPAGPGSLACIAPTAKPSSTPYSELCRSTTGCV